MWVLASAVVSGSLLGSMHCVGMCGPLAIWASGAAENRSKQSVALAATLYHVGRLLTYAIVGALAGVIGSLVDVGGRLLGFQLTAAALVGSLMVIVGASQLWKLTPRGRRAAESQPNRPSLISGLLLRLRPLVFSLPLPARGLVTGMLTTLLPCGWLYLFALIAAGTGSVTMGPIVMAAFWLGTVPALTGLIIGTRWLSRKSSVVLPVAISLMLVIAGCYTASGRGFAALNSLSDIAQKPQLPDAATLAETSPETVQMEISKLTETPLPCCDAVGQVGLGSPEE